MGCAIARGFKDIFFLVFWLTGLLFGSMCYFLMQFYERGMEGVGVAVGLGTGCGLAFGTCIAYCVRSVEFIAPVDPSIDIYTRVQVLLVEMGYRLHDRFQKVIVFKPTLRAGIFADHVRLELMRGQIRMEGPVYHVEKIRSALGL